MRRRQLPGVLQSQLPAPPTPSAAPTAAPGPPQFPWNFFEATKEATADVRISGDVDHAGATSALPVAFVSSYPVQQPHVAAVANFRKQVLALP